MWQPRSSMKRTIILYALALAAAAGLLRWLESRYLARTVPGEVYVAIIAVAFAALGMWVGQRLTPRPAAPGFRRNQEAINSLGLTARECEILELLASGQSNKEMARSLEISPNTVKTHISHVYDKLAVERRVQAIEKARWLAVIP